jgi:DNA adenine methylase
MPGLKPLGKIYGGQWYFRHWLYSLLPANYASRPYLEACLGMGSLFLRKQVSIFEQVNDFNPGTYAIWKMVRDWPDDFRAGLSALSYSRQEFELQTEILAGFAESDALTLKDSTLLKLAVAKYAVLRMSRGGMGKSFAWSDRLRGGQPGDLNAWLNAIDYIPVISDRLQDTTVSNMCCIELAKTWKDNAQLVAYFDPPFLKMKDGGKRKSDSGYESDMTLEQHVALLDALNEMKGAVMLSGYDSQLYTEKLKGWIRHAKEGVNNASQSKSKSKQVAVVWTNY